MMMMRKEAAEVIFISYRILHTSFDLSIYLSICLYVPRDLFISETTSEYNNEYSSAASALEERKEKKKN
jgi:hypothetical protein